MNELPKTIIAVVTLISMAVSSMASECAPGAPSLRLSANPAPLTGPIVLSQKVALNPAELTKYQQLSDHSQDLAAREVAGASDDTKTALIVVGVVAVVAGVCIATTHAHDLVHPVISIHG